MGKSSRKVAIVVSRWNELVTSALRDGAIDELKSAGIKAKVVEVPGTWEVPIVAQKLLQSHDGVVALGCIMQGATNHAGLLAGDVSSALMKLMMESGKPITWRIITPETAEQAFERAGLKMGNKGREAAGALLSVMDALDES